MIYLIKNYYGIVVPKDAFAFEIEDENLSYYDTRSDTSNDLYIEKGKFELVGTMSKEEISFDVSVMLDKDPVNGLYLIHNSAHTTDMWVNNNGNLGTLTRTDYGLPNESLISLINSKGKYFDNPIGEKPILKFSDYDFGEDGLSEAMQESIESDFEHRLQKWGNYQSNLIEKLVIIKKNK